MLNAPDDPEFAGSMQSPSKTLGQLSSEAPNFERLTSFSSDTSSTSAWAAPNDGGSALQAKGRKLFQELLVNSLHRLEGTLLDAYTQAVHLQLDHPQEASGKIASVPCKLQAESHCQKPVNSTVAPLPTAPCESPSVIRKTSVTSVGSTIQNQIAARKAAAMGRKSDVADRRKSAPAWQSTTDLGHEVPKPPAKLHVRLSLPDAEPDHMPVTQTPQEMENLVMNKEMKQIMPATNSDAMCGKKASVCSDMYPSCDSWEIDSRDLNLSAPPEKNCRGSSRSNQRKTTASSKASSRSNQDLVIDGPKSDASGPRSDDRSDSESSHEDFFDSATPLPSRPTSKTHRNSDNDLNAQEYAVSRCWAKEIKNMRGQQTISDSMGLGIFSMVPSVSLRGGRSSAISQSRLFGQEAEKSDEEKQARWHELILHPSSTRYTIWELSGLVLIVYELFSVPLELFELPTIMLLVFINWIVRIYWTINIPVSFLKGYVDSEGNVVLQPLEIGKQYAQTWLPLDLAMVTFDWIDVVMPLAKGWDAMRSLRYVRLLRLVRMFRIQSIMQSIYERVQTEEVILIAGIFKITVLIMGFTHVVACLFYSIGKINFDGVDGWVVIGSVLDNPLSVKYMKSLHWSVGVFFGEQVISPGHQLERGFCVIVLMCTFLISAAFVSSLTTSMTRLQILSSQQAHMFSILRRYMNDQYVSRELCLKIERNAKHSMDDEKRNLPETSIELLKYVSEPLRIELHFEINIKHLCVHPFFGAYCEVNPAGLRKVCHTAVSYCAYHTGDVVFSELDASVCSGMLFPVRGEFSYNSVSARLEKNFTAGMWACEAALWTEWSNVGTLVAKSEGRVLALDVESFRSLVSSFPTSHARSYAALFVAYMNASAINGEKIVDVSQCDAWLEDTIDTVFTECDMNGGSFVPSQQRRASAQAPKVRSSTRKGSLFKRGSQFDLRQRPSMMNATVGRLSAWLAQ